MRRERRREGWLAAWRLWHSRALVAQTALASNRCSTPSYSPFAWRMASIEGWLAAWRLWRSRALVARTALASNRCSTPSSSPFAWRMASIEGWLAAWRLWRSRALVARTALASNRCSTPSLFAIRVANGFDRGMACGLAPLAQPRAGRADRARIEPMFDSLTLRHSRGEWLRSRDGLRPGAFGAAARWSRGPRSHRTDVRLPHSSPFAWRMASIEGWLAAWRLRRSRALVAQTALASNRCSTPSLFAIRVANGGERGMACGLAPLAQPRAGRADRARIEPMFDSLTLRHSRGEWRCSQSQANRSLQ